MTYLLRIVAISLSLLFIAGCQATAKGTVFSELPLSKIYSDTESKIIVYRPSQRTGSGERIGIVVDGQAAGGLDLEGYLIITVEPGSHTLNSDTNSIDKKSKIHLGRGETKFYKADLDNYFATAVWKFKQVDSRAARKELEYLRRSL